MRRLLAFLVFILLSFAGQAFSAMVNVYGRNMVLLDGKWETIIDPFDVGIGWRAIYKAAKATGKTDFIEYSFDPANTLNVPGEFNSQLPELTYLESSVWYKKSFDCIQANNERYFIHFGSVNFLADVYFNGKKLGRHEGGFTPFEFEVTCLIKKKGNSLIVRVKSTRVKNGIPGSLIDWYNYVVIPREV